MAGSWIPTSDALLDPFVNNFQTLIAASPTTYNLVAADATAITAAYTSWHAAFLAATNPTTRTTATIATKNLQKANVLAVVRRYGTTLRANAGLSDALKIGLGLRVPDTSPTPVPPPSVKPELSIARIDIGVQEIVARVEGAGTVRARPAGSVGLLLYRAIGTTPVSSADEATFLTFVGRPQVASTFDAADRGKFATYFARWTNARGEVGPWSNPVSACIAA